MSLINEALKKAQRQRHEGGADPANPSAVTVGGSPRRGKANNTNTVVLFGAGGLVLVVLSVVLTVYLVNRPSADSTRVTSTSVPVAKPATSTPSTPVESSPAIVVPKITPTVSPVAPTSFEPATHGASTPNQPAGASAATASTGSPPPNAAAAIETPPPAATAGTAAQPGTVSSAPTATAAAGQPAPASAAPTLPAGVPDERVAAFVDAIRVTGIRSSGADSRVLMNERVYRVNDIVERNLGVRLIKAAADSLTFSDPRGVTYVKNF